MLDQPVTTKVLVKKVSVVVCLGFAIAIAVGEVTSLLQPEREVQASTTHPRADGALEAVTAAVKSAWIVRPDATDQLVVVDGQGRETRFFGSDGRLLVRRSDGQSGVLLGGFRKVAFETTTRRQLREGQPVNVPGMAWRRTGEVSAPLVLAPGTSLSLGVSLTSRAPELVNTVKGVPEQLLRCEPQRFVLAAAGQPAGHVPCEAHASESGLPTRDVVTLALHEGVGPDDARPFGPAIASVSVPVSSLSPWGGGSSVAEEACWLCPQDAAAPTGAGASELSIDISPMHAALAPGRAYALVVSVEGDTPLVIGATAVPRARMSGSAFRAREEPVFDPVPWLVPARLDGKRIYTSTVPHEVVDKVSVTVTWDDGRLEVAEAQVAHHPVGGRDRVGVSKPGVVQEPLRAR